MDPDVGLHVPAPAQIGHAVGLDRGVDVELAPLDPALGRDRVGGGIVVDAVHADTGGVIEPRVLHRRDVVAQLPVGGNERSVGDIVARVGPGLAVALDRLPRHGIHGGVLGDLQQIGRGVVQGQHDRARIGRRDAEAGGVGLAAVHRLAVLQQIEQVGVGGGGSRIEHPPERIDEVVGGERPPVRPGRRAQVEGPDQPVRRGLPGPGDAGRGPAVGPVLGQTHHQVAQDHLLVGEVDLLGIQRSRVREIAVFQAGLAPRTGGALRPRPAPGEAEGRGQDERQADRIHAACVGGGRMRPG